MSIQPGTYNFTLQRRADFTLALQFNDGNDVGINLLGATVTAQAWNESRSHKYADFAVNYTDRASGQVEISLTDTQTADFPNSLNYDVLVTSAGGLKNYYLEGKISVSQGYSA